MGGMTTFGNNDSVFSHGEDSISMLNRLAEIAKEAFKYIPEKDCTVACGTFVDVDTRAFLSAVQHSRESIEAYCDLTEELDDDLRESRAEYEHVTERIRKYGVQSVDAEKLFDQLMEDCEHFRSLAISRNKELEKERERSNQLEAQVKVLTAERDLAKKLAKQKSGYFDTDITHMYPKTTLNPNNPANFCGNCEHFEICSGVGVCARLKKHKKYKVVDPDDASCSHFESNQVDRDKPDQPCCKACNRDDCDDCTLCPF